MQGAFSREASPTADAQGSAGNSPIAGACFHASYGRE